jgi:hypothetical protein
MNIYKLTQGINSGYDTYDSCVVYAENENTARLIPPSNYEDSDAWVDISKRHKIKVEYIGSNPKVSESGVIVSSFNAG